MEVFDYLISNDMLVYNTNEDFLKARIRIDKYGFVEAKQTTRGVWDDEQLDVKIIPAIRVLKILTDNNENRTFNKRPIL